MEFRILGRTGLRVSAVSFGAGPVSGLMTGHNHDAQLATVAAAIDAGINWFDTAPGYGQGASETNLGRVLSELRAPDAIHIATKVRLPPEPTEPVGEFVRRSVNESLARLERPSITLLQLHNGLTAGRNEEPSSIAPADAFETLDILRKLQSNGSVQFIGLTGTGQTEAMLEVIRSAEFDTMQTSYNMLDASAAKELFPACQSVNMGVFAIRVFAGGALLGQPPSAHTLKTPYFPLALYERDAERAARIRYEEPASMAGRAVRFALSDATISSAIIGLGSADHVREIAGLFA